MRPELEVRDHVGIFDLICTAQRRVLARLPMRPLHPGNLQGHLYRSPARAGAGRSVSAKDFRPYSKIASEPMGVGALQSKHRFRLRGGRNQKRVLTVLDACRSFLRFWRTWRLRSPGAAFPTVLRAVSGLSEPSKQSTAANGGSLDGNQSVAPSRCRLKKNRFARSQS